MFAQVQYMTVDVFSPAIKHILWFDNVNHIRYINNSLHLARKYARIFVRGHYLFPVANSFPRA